MIVVTVARSTASYDAVLYDVTGLGTGSNALHDWSLCSDFATPKAAPPELLEKRRRPAPVPPQPPPVSLRDASLPLPAPPAPRPLPPRQPGLTRRCDRQSVPARARRRLRTWER